MLHSIFTAQDLFYSTPSSHPLEFMMASSNHPFARAFAELLVSGSVIITCATKPDWKNAQLLVCWSFCQSRFWIYCPLPGCNRCKWKVSVAILREMYAVILVVTGHTHGIHVKRETIWVVEKENLGLFGLYLANDIFPVQPWDYHSNPGSTWPMG